MSFVIRAQSIPTGVGAPGWDAFVQTVEARNAAQAPAFGDAASYSAEELILNWTDPNEPKRLLVAEVDGRIVARAFVEWHPEGNDDLAFLTVEVHPDFQGRGIGRALADALEPIALELGRPLVQSYVGHPDGGGGVRLASPTGFGSVPADERAVRFLLARGWELGQVERGSRLELPIDADELASRLAAARERSGGGYRIHRWVGRTPEPFLDDLAMLMTRMGTDAPSGELEEDTDEWTTQRLRDREDAEADWPRTALHVAVEHVGSGRLVGFTDLEVPEVATRPIDQGDTIVIVEHRGHGLGLLLKLEGLALVAEAAPEHRVIVTFNAEENRHMLDVNEAVGFRPFVVEGGWKRRLQADAPAS
jgi:GNAT superfamily N-acetyltransferase